MSALFKNGNLKDISNYTIEQIIIFARLTILFYQMSKVFEPNYSAYMINLHNVASLLHLQKGKALHIVIQK